MTIVTPRDQAVQTDVCKDGRVDDRKDDQPSTGACQVG